MKGEIGLRLVHAHQFGPAPPGEDPSGAGEMEVSGDPASHVEPVHSSSRRGAVLFVQQHQLLLSANRTSLQHPLQLEGGDTGRHTAPRKHCPPP